jgi:polar amino acid transport system permease protein
LSGAVLGFGLNCLRMIFPRALYWPYRIYIWVVRGTPFLSQLVVVYFGLPVVGLTLSAVQATIISLALYGTAYFAEIFRACWASVPHGQIEAARSLGIPRHRVFLRIEMPQALAFGIPLLSNQFILLIKESAVASIITVPELTMTASDIVASTYSYIGPYAMLVLCYWMLTQIVAFGAQRATAFATRHLKA